VFCGPGGIHHYLYQNIKKRSVELRRFYYGYYGMKTN